MTKKGTKTIVIQSADSSSAPIRPALTPDARESQLINLAMNLAEQQLRDGTASSQVITHFLKLGSQREKLEEEQIRKNNDLLEAKKNSIEADAHNEELYENAVAAMKRYNGDYGDSSNGGSNNGQ